MGRHESLNEAEKDIFSKEIGKITTVDAITKEINEFDANEQMIF